jgi:hypothetical protein
MLAHLGQIAIRKQEAGGHPVAVRWRIFAQPILLRGHVVGPKLPRGILTGIDKSVMSINEVCADAAPDHVGAVQQETLRRGSATVQWEDRRLRSLGQR